MKTKIVFAGVMGAILMSVGANAATTSVATKGYVDQLVKGVQTSVDNLGNKYVTIQQVKEAIENNVDLTPYQLTDNIVQTLNNIPDNQKSTKYPSVAAVAEAIENLDLGLTTDQIQQLQDLIKSDGVVSQISTLKGEVQGLKTQVGTDTVANQIASAIATHKTEANDTYQKKSTADFQIGTTGGVFRDMTDAEKAALASGITKAKVDSYDALAGDTGTVAGLRTDVDANKSAIATNKTAIETNKTAIETNKTDIATNAEAITKKLDIPAECQSGNKTCVLMTSNGSVSWTPVTSPIEDPTEGTTVSE